MKETAAAPSLSAVAGLIGEAARAEVLTALLADRALSATELAAVAGVSKSTLSAHLDKLLRGGLLAVARQGRHRYFRLAHADVARALESLLGVAARTAPLARGGGAPLRQGPADPALRKARVCYDHLAGELGVFVYERLVRAGGLGPPSEPAEGEALLALTARGARLFAALGIDVEALRRARRALCRPCLDWSERRYHIAGHVGAEICRVCIERGWLARQRGSRALRITAAGRRGFREIFGVQLAAPEVWKQRRPYLHT
jgi:DNA-binding transcriptional ArsR family regulator